MLLLLVLVCLFAPIGISAMLVHWTGVGAVEMFILYAAVIAGAFFVWRGMYAPKKAKTVR